MGNLCPSTPDISLTCINNGNVNSCFRGSNPNKATRRMLKKRQLSEIHAAKDHFSEHICNPQRFFFYRWEVKTPDINNNDTMTEKSGIWFTDIEACHSDGMKHIIQSEDSTKHIKILEYNMICAQCPNIISGMRRTENRHQSCE